MLKSPNPEILPPLQRLTFERRSLLPRRNQLTCMVLAKHREKARAMLVSDTNDISKAVWIPKSLVIVEQCARAGFIVVTMTMALANQKGLACRWIEPGRYWKPAQIDALNDAKSLAARKRNKLRGFREPLAYPGRNLFA